MKAWIEKTFSQLIDLATVIDDIMGNEESKAMANAPEFFYELAKVNSSAAFTLWGILQQERLSLWLKLNDTQIITTRTFPILLSQTTKLLILKNGKGKIIDLDNPELRLIEKPFAFRELTWMEYQNNLVSTMTYSESELNAILKNDVISLAAIIAGAKYKSHLIATNYSKERIQGGKIINQWSSVATIISELTLSVKKDEALINHLSIDSALSLMSDADQFVSQNMQVMGGAGYMEDYVVERLYRECIFLKNWPLPFRARMVNAC